MDRSLAPLLLSSLALAGCGPLTPELERVSGAPAGARCGAPAVSICNIQGNGPTSPRLGQDVSVEGVVTLAFGEGEPSSGFFMQSGAANAADGCSEGLFVAGSEVLESPPVGAWVRVHGRVEEEAGVTTITAVDLLSGCGARMIEPVSIPTLAIENAEAFESMWLRSPDTWTLLEAGEAWAGSYASAEGRLYAAGHELGASSEVRAARAWTLLPRPPLGPAELSASEPLRSGARAGGATGVVQLGAARRRLLLTAGLDWQSSVPTAPLRSRPGALRVATFNLENYFVDLGGLGARSASELARQRDKLVTAVLGLDADVLGLVELENDANLALAHFASGLNERLALPQRYAFSSTPAPAGSTLRTAILYRPARLQAVGEAWFETSPRFRRSPAFQTLAHGTAVLTIGVVHLKSKRCGTEPEVAQAAEGCGAETRRDEARALAGSISNAALEGPVLIMGDFNSDTLEAPLEELRHSGLFDLLSGVPPEERYSYMFEGRASLLDQIWASPELRQRLANAGVWHINADEPRMGNARAERETEARGSSDHDPVFVDLAL